MDETQLQMEAEMKAAIATEQAITKAVKDELDHTKVVRNSSTFWWHLLALTSFLTIYCMLLSGSTP